MFSHENYPLISVVILNWNGGDYLRRCVKSVIETNYPRNLLEVIVVDNGSTDGSARLAKKMYPQIKLIENGSNLGFCVGNNIGIKYASGSLIILLNNDTIVDKNWIREIVKSARDPKVGIVGCRIYFPGTRIIQTLGFRMKFLGYWENIGAGQVDDGQFDDIEGVDWVSGAALSIKSEVIEKIGFLDPEFYAYCEDMDLCYRARKAGYKVVISNAIVYHYGSVSFDRLPLKKAYLNNRGSLYFIMKHYSPKTLLRYVFEYPLKSFKVNLGRFIRGETGLQRAIISSKNIQQGKVFKKALNIVLLRNVTFFVALLLMIIKYARLKNKRS
ncbi:MAG: glycosyltransferase family 2 protein [Candidatus Freyarchaeota archaeon]